MMGKWNEASKESSMIPRGKMWMQLGVIATVIVLMSTRPDLATDSQDGW